MKPFTNSKRSLNRLFAVFFCVFIFSSAFAQSLNQGILGQVIDKESKQALCGVELIIKNSDPVISVITDEAGYFTLENIPQGRFYVQASSSDYKYAAINEVDIFPGKNEVICIEMTNSKSAKRQKAGLKTKLKGLIAGKP